MLAFSGQIRLDYDSDSDDEELVKHKPIRSGVLASSTDSLLSQCPTTEVTPPPPSGHLFLAQHFSEFSSLVHRSISPR